MYKNRRRSGLTLVELLVSTALTLLLVVAVVQIFAQIGREISAGRSLIEMSGVARNVQRRLDHDLSQPTVPVRPWPESAAAEGYFEIIEGVAKDVYGIGRGNSTVGDIDDVLMFTAYSNGEPFHGRVNGVPVRQSDGTYVVDNSGTISAVESHVAEIVYWTTFIDVNSDNAFDPSQGERLRLHRRVLLVRPDFRFPTATTATYFQHNDVSAHADGTTIVANTLAELTQRENRFGHTGGFPHSVTHNVYGGTLFNLVLSGDRQGEDVIVPEVTAFDVRVWDPEAKLVNDGTSPIALQPGDPGYNTSMTQVARGAYVDLGLASGSTLFAGAVNPKSRLTTATYDTWSLHYEHDRSNQDSDSQTDEGTNHLDDDGQNGVDDVGEYETSPPYPHPLRGIQVTIRMVETDTQQVKQVSASINFTPE